MKALVVHDENGQIKSFTIPKGGLGAGIGVQLAPGEAVLELELPDDLDRSSLVDLPQRYRVDVSQKHLVPLQ